MAGQALGENFAVAAVGTEGEVVYVELKRLADSGRFLPDGQDGPGPGGCIRCPRTSPVVLIRLIMVSNSRSRQHISVDVQELLLGEVAQPRP